MNKTERVTAVIEGHQPDRPPFSFWYHFGPEYHSGPDAVDAHVRHVDSYEIDFLKIMDDNRYPRTATASGVIENVADLDKLTVLGGDEDSLGLQLELIGELAKRFSGQVPMSTTLFNAWGTLRSMTRPDSGVHGPPTAEPELDGRDEMMSQFLAEAPEALSRALNVVSESLANFARHCVSAGANGVFLSVRDDWVDSSRNGVGTYDRLIKDGDLQILAGAENGTLNMLHICGKAIDFGRFADYPVHVINWADRYSGPTIAEVVHSTKPALCAGIDNLGTMVTGSARDCAQEVADALRQSGDRPMMIAPGCTFDPNIVPNVNLHAIRDAVQQGGE